MGNCNSCTNYCDSNEQKTNAPNPSNSYRGDNSISHEQARQNEAMLRNQAYMQIQATNSRYYNHMDNDHLYNDHGQNGNMGVRPFNGLDPEGFKR